jgi:hypothetical protein
MITATTAPEQILSGGDIWFFFLSLSFIDIIWIGEKKAGLWFSPGILVSSANKTDHHDITEILLKVA